MPDWIAMGIIFLVVMGLIILRPIKRCLRCYALVSLNIMDHARATGKMADEENTGIS